MADAEPSLQRARTVISEEKKMVLEEFYSKGMNSKSKKCVDLMTAAEGETGLPVDMIKEWVGNRSRKRPSNQQKTPAAAAPTRQIYTKGVSAYNAFVHEKKDALGTFGGGWSTAWNSLTPSKKALYRDKASKINDAHVPTKTQLMDAINNNIKQLSKYDISVACVGSGTKDGSQVLFGSGVAEEFFLQRPDVMRDLILFCNETKRSINCLDITELRKTATEHLNKLYKTATGISRPLPYKKVFTGDILISGLPEDVMPLQFPSHYGRNKLMAIINCQSIEVLQPSGQPSSHTLPEQEPLLISHELTEVAELAEVATVSAVAEVSTVSAVAEVSTVSAVAEVAAVSTVIVAEVAAVSTVAEVAAVAEETAFSAVTEEDADVLMPLFPDLQPVKGIIKNKSTDKKKNEQYYIERIVREKRIKGRKQFLVKWLGYPDTENTWEPKQNIPKIFWDKTYH